MKKHLSSKNLIIGGGITASIGIVGFCLVRHFKKKEN